MSEKKTYFPAKTFDDDLVALVQLFMAKGWNFPGAGTEQLAADAAAQRKDRQEHDALEAQYLALHERFGIDQEARYERFFAALEAARGAFRQDRPVLAELERFKRSVRRRKSSGDPQ